tara:strand:- start:720 stop:941 length:222 start_codon:yes stop_codon:yes gene_type:complete
MAITTEEIAHHYSGMLDCVALINEFQSEATPFLINEEEVTNAINRNIEHLQLMITKDYWTDEDMTSVNAAISE